MNPVKDFISRAAEIIPALFILAWRLWMLPARDLWRDWIVVASLYWILLVLAGKNRVWQVLTTVMMALLLVIYTAGQGPHTAALLGYAP